MSRNRDVLRFALFASATSFDRDRDCVYAEFKLSLSRNCRFHFQKTVARRDYRQGGDGFALPRRKPQRTLLSRLSRSHGSVEDCKLRSSCWEEEKEERAPDRCLSNISELD